jgi:hypothetical protein
VGDIVFRISQAGQEPFIDVDTVDQIEPAIRSCAPGRYHVDEISADLLPSGHSSRRYAVAIKKHDGSVTIEPDLWEA